jgi:hypothetical protein
MAGIRLITGIAFLYFLSVKVCLIIMLSWRISLQLSFCSSAKDRAQIL